MKGIHTAQLDVAFANILSMTTRKHVRYTKELLDEAVHNSTSIRGIMSHLGLRHAGGTHAHISKKLKEYGIDTSHFLGSASNKGRTFKNQRKSPEVILVCKSSGSPKEKTHILRRAILEVGFKEECALCHNNGIWNGLPLTLEIDHINGNNLDNTKDNLRFLCPNCHSQQENTNLPHKYRIS